VKGVCHSDRDEIGIVVAVGIRAYLKILFFMILGGIGLSLCVAPLLSVQGAIANELQIGFYIYLTCLLFIPLNVFQLLIDAHQRSYFKNSTLIFQSFITTGLLLWFAWLKLGIPGQFTALLIGNLFLSLLLSWESLRRYPNLVSLILHPPKERVLDLQKRLWRLNVPGLVLHLAARIGLLSDNLFVSFFLGPAAVVPFLITQRLAAMAQSQLQSVTSSTWAALADLNARKEYQTFNVCLTDLTKLMMVMGLTIVIPILAYNIHFVTLWVGTARFGGWAVTGLVACNVVLRSVLYLWEWCFIGTGTQAIIMRLSVISAIVNVVISFIATQWLGLSGPLIGTLVSTIGLSSWWMPRLLKQTFGTNLARLYAVIARPLLIGVPYGAIVVWISLHHTPSGWIGLAIEMTSAAMVHLVLAWGLVLNSSDRAVWHHRLIALLPKRILKQVVR
jgi:O-antigen/teichoic acid export membrane protein